MSIASAAIGDRGYNVRRLVGAIADRALTPAASLGNVASAAISDRGYKPSAAL